MLSCAKEHCHNKNHIYYRKNVIHKIAEGIPTFIIGEALFQEPILYQKCISFPRKDSNRGCKTYKFTSHLGSHTKFQLFLARDIQYTNMKGLNHFTIYIFKTKSTLLLHKMMISFLILAKLSLFLSTSTRSKLESSSNMKFLLCGHSSSKECSYSDF